MGRWSAVLKGVCLFAVVVALAPSAGAQTPVAPQSNWRQLDSPHFHLVGNAGERDIRKVAEAFEQFRDAMALLFPEALDRVDLPTTIVVFKDQRSYTPFKPLFQGKPVQVGGYFMPGADVNYITLTAERLDESLRIVYHEFVHLIVNNVHAGLPLWANEGLAEYYSTFAVTDGGRKVALGRAVADHVYRLRESFMPLTELTSLGRDSQHYNEGDKRSIFYAESWALMHYLLLGEKQVHGNSVPALLAQLAAGATFEQAAPATLGVDVVTLEKGLRRYVDQSRFVSQVVTFEERLAAIERVAATPASPADVHAILGALLVRMSRPDEARAQLAEALRQAPDAPAPHTVLGLMLLETDHATAMAHLERASVHPDASYLAQFQFAQGLERQRRESPSEPDAASISARMDVALQRAIELRPSFPESYHLLAHLKARREETLGEAEALMGKALQLAPGREDYLLFVATLHARRERLVPARVIAARLAARASSASVQQHARELVARLDAYQREKDAFARAGAAPTPPSSFVAPTTSDDGAARFIPSLRQVASHERRAHGFLVAIDCQADGGVVLHVDADATPLRASAKSFGSIDFITYRTDLDGSIPCGRRPQPQAVYLTFTPADPPTEGNVGEAVAVEFLPDGFVPAAIAGREP